MDGWTLVFDLDGTLVDTAPDLAAATNHVLAHRNLPPVDAREILPFVGHGALKMIENALAAHGKTLSESELYAMFDVFIQHYTANIANASRPYEGALAAIDGFRAEGAALAVCTNKLEAHARALLEALDMTPRFNAITGRDSLGVFKPDPRHLTSTIALANGTADKAIMIGDTETDIATAKAAGIPVIAVDFGYSTTPVAVFAPDIIISHFNELPRAVARIRGGIASPADAA
ncbi:MAG: HAD-IA family hydrolase [Hyphomicrobium sp.]